MGKQRALNLNQKIQRRLQAHTKQSGISETRIVTDTRIKDNQVNTTTTDSKYIMHVFTHSFCLLSEEGYFSFTTKGCKDQTINLRVTLNLRVRYQVKSMN